MFNVNHDEKIVLTMPRDQHLEKLLIEEVLQGNFLNFRNYCQQHNVTEIAVCTNNILFVRQFADALQPLHNIQHIAINRYEPPAAHEDPRKHVLPPSGGQEPPKKRVKFF